MALLLGVYSIANVGATAQKEYRYMDAYEMCLTRTKQLEGGDVNDPDDLGGKTRWGLSLRFLQRCVQIEKDGYMEGDLNHDGEINEADIDALTYDVYQTIIKTHFWDVFPMAKIAGRPNLQWKLFDLGVHSSPLNSIKTLQMAVGVTPDGEWGNLTQRAIDSTPDDTLISKFKYYQLRYYNRAIINRPTNFKYIKNWTARAHQEL